MTPPKDQQKYEDVFTPRLEGSKGGWGCMVEAGNMEERHSRGIWDTKKESLPEIPSTGSKISWLLPSSYYSISCQWVKANWQGSLGNIVCTASKAEEGWELDVRANRQMTSPGATWSRSLISRSLSFPICKMRTSFLPLRFVGRFVTDISVGFSWL